MNTNIELFLQEEVTRLKDTINLIASENYPSKKVRKIIGSILTSKYAEGYPGKRYYNGCKIIDKIENYTIQLAKELFGAEFVNVQLHSGSSANLAIYSAVLKENDVVLSMDLKSGGHLSHGSKVNFSGKFYNFIHYSVNRETQLIDYNEIERLAQKYKPRLIIAGASAYSREIDFQQIAEIAHMNNAILLADISHISGLIIAGLHNSPIKYADFVTTTTHKTLRGPRGAIIMAKSRYSRAINRAVMPGLQGGPFMNIIAAKAAAFEEALSSDFRKYQYNVVKNSKTLAKELVKYGFDIVSGGTDTHMFLIDLRNKKIFGRDAANLLENYNIIVNSNAIPYDDTSVMLNSGIRIGTPAITTLGATSSDMILLASWINRILKDNKKEFSLKKDIAYFISKLNYDF